MAGGNNLGCGRNLKLDSEISLLSEGSVIKTEKIFVTRDGEKTQIYQKADLTSVVSSG